MPKPHSGESQDDFIGRCISELVGEGRDQDQAAAICFSIWREHSAPVQNRAYSFLEIKSVQEDERIIEGMATTPTVDRVGDIVQPLGAKFRLPMPLLWQHRVDTPVGHVTLAKPTEKGIHFRAKFAKIDEPGELKNSIDKAWQAVKAKLVAAVSIGFQTLKYEIIEKTGGYDIKEWDWLELSLVTIPAQSEATIDTIKSVVADELAATGRDKPAGVPAQRKPVVKAKEAKTIMAKKSIAEQIAAFEATRQAKAARMAEIMEEAAETGETLNEAQKEEYDTLQDEVKELDAHLKRLADHQKMSIAQAKPVAGSTPEIASESRSTSGVRVTGIREQLPLGQRFVRVVIAKIAAKLNDHGQTPAEIAKQRWPDCPEIEMYLKAPVAAGTTTGTTWAAPLVELQNMPGEFAELLRPMTIIGRLPGLRRVPFNIKVPRQTGGSTVNWIGEAKVKPISALTFDQIELAFTKIAGIVPMSNELIRFSSPSAEAIVRQDLTAAIAQFMDSEFLDPTKAAAAGVSPASVLNGVTPVPASGTSAAALRTDVANLLETFIGANMTLGGAVWVMTETQALNISLMRTALDQPEFPGVAVTGGTFLGLPLITSENIVDIGGSPANGSIIALLKTNEIMLADDGGVDISVSQEASLQMDSAPDSPPTASTVMVSLWQHNMTAIRAERFIHWLKRRAEAAGYISYAKYSA